MNFIYRAKKYHISKKLKSYIESEFNELLQKYFFMSENDRVHVEIEMLKEEKIEAKIEISVLKLGKKYTSSHSDENIYKTINELKRKSDIQLKKTKEKKFDY